MQYHSFMIILYPDCEAHVKCLDWIIENIEYYAYILHDNDYNEFGEIKKEHYHVVIKFDDNEKYTISSLSKMLNIEPQYISKTTKSYINGLRYLIHADDKSKYQYSIENVEGTLKDKLVDTLKENVENEKMLKIIDIIDSLNFIEIREFTQIICAHGLYSYYRRSFAIIHLIIKQQSSL